MLFCLKDNYLFSCNPYPRRHVNINFSFAVFFFEVDLQQRFSNSAAPQGLARCVTLAFRKFTTCFLHYSLFSEIYKIGYDDHLEDIRHCNYCSHILGTKPFSWHAALKKKQKQRLMKLLI